MTDAARITTPSTAHSPASPIRIGTVEYLNTDPLVAGLDRAAGFRLVPAVPSRVIDLLQGDSVDLGLVSLIDVVRSAGSLTVLPVGMIGCDGPTMTVRIFSTVPLDQIRTLHADTDSHTSVALARVLLAKIHGIRPEIRDFHARERPFDADDDQAPEAVLLIGDKVVSASPPAVRYPHSMDLGDAWHTLTGLPFVYAVWACKAERAEEPGIRSAAALLDRTRRRNQMRADQIVNASAARHRWPIAMARDYVGSLLRYDLDERAASAIPVFVGMCRELGVIGDDAAAPVIGHFGPGGK